MNKEFLIGHEYYAENNQIVRFKGMSMIDYVMVGVFKNDSYCYVGRIIDFHGVQTFLYNNITFVRADNEFKNE